MTSMPAPQPKKPVDIDQIKVQLQSEKFGDRIQGINQLRQADPMAAFTLIAPLCSDPNTRVRYAAVSQLATLGEHNRPQAYDLLITALDDAEADVQGAAADALGALKFTNALEKLDALYRRSSEWLVKMSIVAGLGVMGDFRAFDLLSQALKDDNDLVCVSAIGALGDLGDERAIPLLLSYADSEDWQVRHRTAVSLSRFMPNAEVEQVLKKLAQDTSAVVAEAAQSRPDDA